MISATATNAKIFEQERGWLFNHIREVVPGFHQFCIGLRPGEVPAGFDCVGTVNLVYALTHPAVAEAAAEAMGQAVEQIVERKFNELWSLKEASE